MKPAITRTAYGSHLAFSLSLWQKIWRGDCFLHHLSARELAPSPVKTSKPCLTGIWCKVQSLRVKIGVWHQCSHLYRDKWSPPVLLTELRFLPKPVISRAHVGITRKGLSIGKEVRKAREVARKSSQRSRKHLSLKPAPGTVVQRVWPATSAVLHVTHSVIHVMEKYVVRQDVLVKEQFWIAPINLRSIRSWGKSCIFRHERLIFRMNASLHHTRNHTLTMFMLAVCVSQKCWWIWPSVCSESFCLLSLFPGPDIENWLTNVQINNNYERMVNIFYLLMFNRD